MKNETYDQVVNGYTNQLLHWDARKKVLAEMIKDLNAQYTTAYETWDNVWRERQQYINEHEND